jgi:hypothetical protein
MTHYCNIYVSRKYYNNNNGVDNNGGGDDDDDDDDEEDDDDVDYENITFIILQCQCFQSVLAPSD